ncbi:hypothetical protein C8R43DRAFT_1029339 [Mycena crocata]|nr:hypothetical protein C8R43DRAFT_1029339 [Mycena crocata]
MASPQGSPTLPPELERLIFEISAIIYPESMPVLLLVARRVKLWIEPILYAVLSIYPALEKPLTPAEELESSEEILHRELVTVCNLIDSKPAAFFHDNVRHIHFIARRWSAQTVIKILSVCDAAVNLYFEEVTHPGGPNVLPLLGAMTLQRLSIALPYFFPALAALDFSLPLFDRLTHLDLWEWRGGDWPVWSGLALIPGLTHLAFHDRFFSESVCYGALAHCPHLQVLVLVCESSAVLNDIVNDDAYSDAHSDPRLVALIVPDRLGDWEAGAHAGQDYWVRADEHVRQRRADNGKEFFIVE